MPTLRQSRSAPASWSGFLSNFAEPRIIALAPGGLLHGTSVCLDRAGILILGPSGSGKSALALELLAHGARLVSDDQTIVTPTQDGLTLNAPAAIKGRIEARGMGILRAEPVTDVPLQLVIDRGTDETDRLPPMRQVVLCGQPVPCLHNIAGSHFSAAIVQYIRGGRSE